MIRSFANPSSADIYNGVSSRESRRIPRTIGSVARRKLDMVNAAHQLRDLMAPPANRLEALKGNRKGLHSIRINDQLRVMFRWLDGNAYEVEVVDYH